MELPKIIERIDELEAGKLLRRVDATEKSSRLESEQNFYIKLGPHPAWSTER